MYRRLISILVLALACVSLSFADEDRQSVWDSIANQFNINEIQVTAALHESSAVIPVQRLEGAKLEALSTQSVADALRFFSGVQIKDYGGIGGVKTIDVRSMGTHHLGVFYDGIEIGNAQNGTVDLGKFSMENIEEIALYNGQKTEIFQPAKDFGSAGTLYIRTRRPKFADGRNYHITATMKAGTFGLANPSLLYEQRLTDNIHLSVNAEYTYATGRYHFNIRRYYPDGSIAWDTTGIRQNGDIQTERAEVGLFGYLPEGKWHVKGYFYNSEKGIPRAIIRNVWTSSQRQWDRNAFVQGNFTNEWSLPHQKDGQPRTVALQLNAKYSNDYMRYLNPDTTMVYIDNQFWQQEVYLSIANKWSVLSWWDIDLSADYIWNRLDATLMNFVNPQRHTGLVAVATAFHYKWLQAQASALGTFVTDITRNQNRETAVEQQLQSQSQKPRITPAVSFSVQPYLPEQLFLRGFYKQVFRMPTFNDLYYTDMGNIHLEPEEATQYDGGVEYTKNVPLSQRNGVSKPSSLNFHLKCDGYFNQIKNKIVAVPKGNSQYRWMMMNLGYVEIRGVDLNAGLDFHIPLTHSPSHPLTLSFSGTYTYQKAQDFTDPDDPFYGGQIAYIPWHSCSAIANISWNGLSVNYSFIYVGERYHNSANIPANYEQPWYTHDLSISKLWTLPVGKLSTAVEINNLLNQQYNVILNYPMPGINGKVVVKYML